MKVVEISIETFQSMVDEIQALKEENAELRKAVQYLNAQIRDYNERFAGKNQDSDTPK